MTDHLFLMQRSQHCLALSGVVFLPLVLKFVGLTSTTEWLLAVLQWPFLFVTLVGEPCLHLSLRPQPQRCALALGDLGEHPRAMLWMAASMLFSWYVATFDSYNKTYGSLGAGVGFMIWLWLSAAIVLLGAEFNAETEHQNARDSTEGVPKPLGSRGAMMADHIGEARSED